MKSNNVEIGFKVLAVDATVSLSLWAKEGSGRVMVFTMDNREAHAFARQVEEAAKFADTARYYPRPVASDATPKQYKCRNCGSYGLHGLCPHCGGICDELGDHHEQQQGQQEPTAGPSA